MDADGAAIEGSTSFKEALALQLASLRLCLEEEHCRELEPLVAEVQRLRSTGVEDGSWRAVTLSAASVPKRRVRVQSLKSEDDSSSDGSREGEAQVQCLAGWQEEIALHNDSIPKAAAVASVEVSPKSAGTAAPPSTIFVEPHTPDGASPGTGPRSAALVLCRAQLDPGSPVSPVHSLRIPDVKTSKFSCSTSDSLGDGRVSRPILSRAQSIALELAALAEQRHSFGGSGGLAIRPMWNLDDDKLLRIKRRPESQNQHFANFGSTMSQNRIVSPTGGSISEHPSRRSQSSSQVRRERDRCTVHPQSRERMAWEIFAVVLLTYDLIVVPMQTLHMPQTAFFAAMEWLSLSYWVCDIAASFLTGVYVKKRNKTEMRYSGIAINYLRTWFPFDIFVVLLEFTTIALSISSGVSDTSSETTGRAGRMVRIARFLRLVRLLRIFKFNRLLDDLKARLNSDAVILSFALVKLCFFMIFYIHALACIWYWAGDTSSGWVHTLEIDEKGLADRYLYSFQWSLARLHPMTMTDNLDLGTTFERLWALLATLLAVVFGSIFLSTVTTTMGELKALRKKRNEVVGLIRSYVLRHTISHALTVRMKRYVETVHEKKTHLEKESELVKLLPTNLLMDLRHEAWSPLVGRHIFFELLCDRHVRTEHELCLRAISEVSFFSDEIVFTTGDACDRMAFAFMGKLTYTFGASTCTSPTNAATHNPEPLLAWDNTQEAPPKVRLSALVAASTPNHGQASVYRGQWLSEAVLWTPWENTGELQMLDSGSILAVNAEEFGSVIRLHEQAYIDATIYARCFIEELGGMDREEISDLRVHQQESYSEKEDLIEPKSMRKTIAGKLFGGTQPRKCFGWSVASNSMQHSNSIPRSGRKSRMPESMQSLQHVIDCEVSAKELHNDLQSAGS